TTKLDRPEADKRSRRIAVGDVVDLEYLSVPGQEITNEDRWRHVGVAELFSVDTDGKNRDADQSSARLARDYLDVVKVEPDRHDMPRLAACRPPTVRSHRRESSERRPRPSGLAAQQRTRRTPHAFLLPKSGDRVPRFWELRRYLQARQD